MTLEKIKKYLMSKIKVNFIHIIDNSLLHNHSKKNITHLKIIIISDDFIKKNFVHRHRMIFEILSEIVKEKIYSITLDTYTSNEWEKKKNKKISVSKCLKKNDILLDK